MLIRDRSAASYDLALVTTNTAATAAQVIERYAARWSIEVAIEDARQAIATCWYATACHDPADVADHRARAPWYVSKAQPSTADMAAKLRRVIIAARFKASRPDQPTSEEISILRLAWEKPRRVTTKVETEASPPYQTRASIELDARHAVIRSAMSAR